MLFPSLELESTIQENDRTRLSGRKSYVSDGTPIASIQVTPYKGAAPILVTSAKSTAWYIDYQYEFKLDVDATNNEINFDEGGGELTATVASAQYTLVTLATAIKAALDTAGGQAYTVSFDDGDKATISAPGVFSLLPVSGTSTASLLPEIGFDGFVDESFDLTVDADDFEDYTLKATYTGASVDTVNKLVTLLVDDGSGTASTTATIKIISERGDALWSDDEQLELHEPDILRHVKAGRNTFKDQHRLAQTQILGWMDKEGYTDVFNRKYTKAAMVLPDEFTQWSKFTALRLIYSGLSNAIDDVFRKKSEDYGRLEQFHRDRTVIRLDVDRDGDVDLNELVDTRSPLVLRR